MIAAVVALAVALVALATPFVVGTSNGAAKAATPQTVEFYVVSTEDTFDVTPNGLNHYIFQPNQITVNQGDTVIIHFYNTADDTHHTFTLPAYNINVDVAPQSNKDIQFTASQAGVFTFTCTIHAPTMRGQLVVLSAQ